MSVPQGPDRPEPGGLVDQQVMIPRQFARTDSSERFSDPADRVGAVAAEFDRRLVKDSFAHLLSEPDQAMEYLYGRLFAANPEMRSLFPLSMTQTRAAVFRTLARLFWSIENGPATVDSLADEARSHRKFGIREKHYQPFFDALLATVEHRSGSSWTPEAISAWRLAVEHFTAVMSSAARADAQDRPAWWTSEVIQHDRRTDSVAVLSVRPDKPLSYLPGQYVAVQVPRWPRVWRRYSIANAPRGNGLLDLHVRAIPGGLVSSALVSRCGPGDTLILGPARGDLRIVPDAGRDLVCVAGGTGLAPIKAIVEAIVTGSGQGRRRAVTLYVGARKSDELYDMRDLETLRLAYPSLTLIPVVESGPSPGMTGKLPEAVAAHTSFRACDVYIAGPAGLISATVRALSTRVPADRLHHDPLDALRQAERPPEADAPAAATRVTSEQ